VAACIRAHGIRKQWRVPLAARRPCCTDAIVTLTNSLASSTWSAALLLLLVMLLLLLLLLLLEVLLLLALSLLMVLLSRASTKEVVEERSETTACLLLLLLLLSLAHHFKRIETRMATTTTTTTKVEMECLAWPATLESRMATCIATASSSRWIEPFMTHLIIDSALFRCTQNLVRCALGDWLISIIATTIAGGEGEHPVNDIPSASSEYLSSASGSLL
jgi:uncharacterized membrane protein